MAAPAVNAISFWPVKIDVVHAEKLSNIVSTVNVWVGSLISGTSHQDDSIPFEKGWERKKYGWGVFKKGGYEGKTSGKSSPVELEYCTGIMTET